MKSNIKLIFGLFALCFWAQSQAVYVNPKGNGEVLIFPYYTVNGNFNTFYSVVNNTDQPKALKIRFLEGLNGVLVLEFNVYLSAHDVWTGLLTPITSTIVPHVGEPSASHFTDDQSCAPFLNLSAQEFLPYAIPLDDTNRSMERSTEGHIEVIDMGVVTGSSAAALQQGSNGTPNDCGQLSDAWSFGYWSSDPTIDMADPIGGLTGSGLLLNVTDGHMMAYDAVGLSDFWQGPASHTEPGAQLPTLASAAPNSVVQVDGVHETYTWNHGFEAVSSVLMKHNVYNQYEVQTFIQGQTDWILSWPTKSYHTTLFSNQLAPFSETWDGTESCEQMLISQTDRDTWVRTGDGLNACRGQVVLTFQSNQAQPGSTANLFDSQAEILVPALNELQSNEIGWGHLRFDSPQQRMIDQNSIGLVGSPVIGFSATKYENQNALPGILAIYSDVKSHKHQTKATQDLIFEDGFDPAN